MGKIMLNDIEYTAGGSGGSNDVELTWAEYQALSYAEKMNGSNYFITDAVPESKEIQPVIYSDTEREIGVWRDGKPLYQKTIYVDDIGTGSPTEISLAGLDIDTAIDIQAQVTYESNTGKWHLLPYIEPGSPNSSIGLRIELNTTPQRLYLIPGSDYASGAQWYLNHFLATIQYTKTTDTAGSGIWVPSGVPAVHYSEDEQVIGTWIDGETLYQKTYQLESQLTVSNSSWTSTNIPDPGISTISQCFGCDKNDHTYYPMCAIASDNVIKLWASRPNSNAFITHFTIQYTKTTD